MYDELAFYCSYYVINVIQTCLHLFILFYLPSVVTSTKSMERDLIRDIVFILQGIDGNNIKTTSKGTFEIVTKVRHQTIRHTVLSWSTRLKMTNFICYIL